MAWVRCQSVWKDSQFWSLRKSLALKREFLEKSREQLNFWKILVIFRLGSSLGVFCRALWPSLNPHPIIGKSCATLSATFSHIRRVKNKLSRHMSQIERIVSKVQDITNSYIVRPQIKPLIHTVWLWLAPPSHNLVISTNITNYHEKRNVNNIQCEKVTLLILITES